MNWRIFIYSGVVIVSLLLNVSLAEAQTAMPLTLSTDQAEKLKKIFPGDVTEKDTGNAYSNTPSEHLVWNKVPLTIVLPLNKERMISFPEPIKLAYDETILSDDVMGKQNVGGTLYLVAKKSFTPQRVFVELKQSGELILLNLSANTDADDTPLSIVLPQDNVAVSTPNNESSEVSEQTSPSEMVDYTELSRFAIQQLYAPKRLLSNPPNIFRVPMHTTRTVPLVEGDSVIAMPLISWRSGDEFITAVMLRNSLHEFVTLDPRNFRGQWKTATFFPQTRLAPAGNNRDSTTVFLISDQSFSESLEG